MCLRARPVGQEKTAWVWKDMVRVVQWERSRWVDGSTCCPWIPFVLIVINQSDLSPLLDPYSDNPLVDPKTHTGIQAIVFFSLSWFSWLPMFIWLYSIFRFPLSRITPYHIFLLQLWHFCLLSAPLLFHCLHIPYCFYFYLCVMMVGFWLSSWSMCCPALNHNRYIG